MAGGAPGGLALAVVFGADPPSLTESPDPARV